MLVPEDNVTPYIKFLTSVILYTTCNETKEICLGRIVRLYYNKIKSGDHHHHDHDDEPKDEYAKWAAVAE